MSLPSSMADFVPCDRLLQKAYWKGKGTEKKDVLFTGGDNSNKRCFGTKPKLFRESGDYSRNQDT